MKPWSYRWKADVTCGPQRFRSSLGISVVEGWCSSYTLSIHKQLLRVFDLNEQECCHPNAIGSEFEICAARIDSFPNRHNSQASTILLGGRNWSVEFRSLGRANCVFGSFCIQHSLDNWLICKNLPELRMSIIRFVYIFSVAHSYRSPNDRRSQWKVPSLTTWTCIPLFPYSVQHMNWPWQSAWLGILSISLSMTAVSTTAGVSSTTVEVRMFEHIYHLQLEWNII